MFFFFVLTSQVVCVRKYFLLITINLVVLSNHSSNASTLSLRSLQQSISSAPTAAPIPTTESFIPTISGGDDNASDRPTEIIFETCYLCGNETLKVDAGLKEIIGSSLCSSVETYGRQKLYDRATCTDFQDQVLEGACTCISVNNTNTPLTPSPTILNVQTTTAPVVLAPSTATQTPSSKSDAWKNNEIMHTISVVSFGLFAILI
jgi:hypothetical protein